MKLLVKKVSDRSVSFGINIITGLPSVPSRTVKFDLFIDGVFVGTASMFGFDLRTKFVSSALTKSLFDGALYKYLKKHRSKLLDVNKRKTFVLPENIRYW